MALGAGPSGFPQQLRGDGRSFRDSHGKPAPSFARAPLFWRWGLARQASRNNFPGDGQSICDSVPRARFRRFSAGEWPDGLPETSFRATQASATAMANPRRRLRALRHCGAAGWPVGLPETIFGATAKASATASLAPASVVLALGSGRTGFPKQVSERCKAGGSWTPPRHMRPEAYVATRARIIKGEDQGSGRNGRFINKRTNGQISRFGLRMADFILSRLRSSSLAKPSHFYQGLAEWQLYQGRPAAVAVLSKPTAVLSRPASLWPFYQEWPLYQG